MFEGLKDVRGTCDFIKSVYRKGLHQIFRFSPPGTNIYEREWDVLVVLDACRYDLLETVSSDYEFLTTLDSIRSVDTMTPEWMRTTFTPEYTMEMAETQYVSGNPFSEVVLDDSQFYGIDQVWKYAWDDDFGTVTPDAVTERAVHHGRNTDAERLLIHYMQPHWPFVPAPELSRNSGITPRSFGTYNPNDVWVRLRKGEVDAADVWDGYEANLRYALDSVETLRRNLAADTVVVTSDHGNSFGDWLIYGHPMHMPIESLRKVPWVETTATDEGSLEPSLDPTVGDEQIKQKLSDIGYI